MSSTDLEVNDSRQKRRRHTEFYFRRLREGIVDTVEPSQPFARNTDVLPCSNGGNGIPSIRHTTPGDEVSETVAYRTAARRQNRSLDGSAVELKPSDPALESKELSTTAEPLELSGKTKLGPFQPASNKDAALVPSHDGGIRKKSTTSKQMAVFIQSQRSAGSQAPQSVFHRQSTQAAPLIQKGESITDHPSTWNQQSDQLADELAALALDMDPELSTVAEHGSTPSDHLTKSSEHEKDEDYVFETYVRMPQAEYPVVGDVGAGIIVVEDDDQDFWETFTDDAEDKTWDEEDADSNGKTL